MNQSHSPSQNRTSQARTERDYSNQAQGNKQAQDNKRSGSQLDQEPIRANKDDGRTSTGSDIRYGNSNEPGSTNSNQDQDRANAGRRAPEKDEPSNQNHKKAS